MEKGAASFNLPHFVLNLLIFNRKRRCEKRAASCNLPHVVLNLLNFNRKRRCGKSAASFNLPHFVLNLLIFNRKRRWKKCGKLQLAALCAEFAEFQSKNEDVEIAMLEVYNLGNH
jgi:hypothetical protein